MHWNCLSVSYRIIPFSKTNALYFLSTEILRHPEIEKQPVPGLEIYCSGGISSEFKLWSGRYELGEVVGAVVWVHLINAGKNPIVHHHWNRCSAACRTRRLNIVTVVPNTSAALPYFFSSLCFLPVIWKNMALSLYWCFKGQRGVKASYCWTMWLLCAISCAEGVLRHSQWQPSPGETLNLRKQMSSLKISGIHCRSGQSWRR